MKKLIIASCAAAVGISVILPALGDELCAGESEAVLIDLTTGTRTVAHAELIRYSSAWVSGADSEAVAVVEVNGETLNAAAGGGYVDWTPMSNGIYILTHKVMSGDVQVGEVLSATFLVEEVFSSTQTTEVSVPYAWLRQYAPNVANNYEAYESAAKATAANGRNKVWECYVAGISPTNVASVFTAGIEIVGGVPQVTWSPNLNTNGVVRSYTIWGKESLTDAAWHSPTNAADRFFKVSVEMP